MNRKTGACGKGMGRRASGAAIDAARIGSVQRVSWWETGRESRGRRGGSGMVCFAEKFEDNLRRRFDAVTGD